MYWRSSKEITNTDTGDKPSLAVGSVVISKLSDEKQSKSYGEVCVIRIEGEGMVNETMELIDSIG